MWKKRSMNTFARHCISLGSYFLVLQACSTQKMVTNKMWQSHVWRCTTCATVYCTYRIVIFHNLMLLVLYCNYTECAGIKPMYIIRSSLSSLHCLDAEILIGVISFKLFEKCIFVLRTELMVWGKGPTSYIMLTIEKQSCGSVVEHCVSSANGCGLNSQGTHILTKKM